MGALFHVKVYATSDLGVVTEAINHCLKEVLIP